jgi:hypothetical protein
MLALNFFNVRVLPSHMFDWNHLPSLFKSIAFEKASLFYQASMAKASTEKPALSAAVKTGRLAAG